MAVSSPTPPAPAPEGGVRRGLGLAVVGSLAIHAMGAFVMSGLGQASAPEPTTSVDVDLAPPPPEAEALPREVAQGPVAPLPTPAPLDPGAGALLDAAPAVPDAAPVFDARPKRKRPRPDAALVAPGDASLASEAVASSDATGASADAALATASVSGDAAMAGVPSDETLAGVDGAAPTPGTASNLLTYVPPDHTVAVMLRFDRVRDSIWEKPVEGLLRTLPDYGVLFGANSARLIQKFEALTFASPAPRDATATTLGVRTKLPRAAIRGMLTQRDTPIEWRVAAGGMLGVRGPGRKAAHDARVLLSPRVGYFVLTKPEYLGPLLEPAPGELDTVEAAAVPAWLDQLQRIEQEAGVESGPFLVLTVRAKRERWRIPVAGLGADHIVSPERSTLAVEAVPQGWLLRGNLLFDAPETAAAFVTTARMLQASAPGSPVLRMVLHQSHAVNAIVGLSLVQAGRRVSYATSLSVADARGLLLFATGYLEGHFRGR